MDSSSSLIINVVTTDYPKVVIETSGGYRYHADLSAFSAVYCFPKNSVEWAKVSIDASGRDLVWGSRFEVHLDQVIGLAAKIEKISRSA